MFYLVYMDINYIFKFIWDLIYCLTNYLFITQKERIELFLYYIINKSYTLKYYVYV